MDGGLEPIIQQCVNQCWYPKGMNCLFVWKWFFCTSETYLKFLLTIIFLYIWRHNLHTWSMLFDVSRKKYPNRVIVVHDEHIIKRTTPWIPRHIPLCFSSMVFMIFLGKKLIDVLCGINFSRRGLIVATADIHMNASLLDLSWNSLVILHHGTFIQLPNLTHIVSPLQ